MLFAHNRLRNPRFTSGNDVPAVLTMFNCIIYDWLEYATHTGSERVRFNWLNNIYKPGPATPPDIATHAFEFHGDPEARLFARGQSHRGLANIEHYINNTDPRGGNAPVIFIAATISRAHPDQQGNGASRARVT